jgi:hypothetical protein
VLLDQLNDKHVSVCIASSEDDCVSLSFVSTNLTLTLKGACLMLTKRNLRALIPGQWARVRFPE